MSINAPRIKRTREARTFDIDCSALLGAGVTISGAVELLAEPVTDPPLAFAGTAVVPSSVTYDDGRVAPASTVIRTRISGGLVATGLPHQEYTLRAIFTASDGDTVEATVTLRVDDTP